MKILTPTESRAADQRAIAAGTPGIVLMERAAASVVREIAGLLAARPAVGADVVVLCGGGNNGGDGFEVARLLDSGRLGARVTALFLGEPDGLPADAARTYRRLAESGARVSRVGDAAGLEPLRSATLVVDALLGTGLSRPVPAGSLASAAIGLLSAGRAFVVAVDLPSGLDGGREEIPGPAVRADLTVTFGSPKRAHAFLPAAGLSGRVVVAPIGLDVESPGGSGDAGTAEAPEAVTALDVAPLFPGRPSGAHKGNFGTLHVAGGAEGMAGASALAARGALRAGAGKVSAELDPRSRVPFHSLVAEATSTAWGEGSAGADVAPAAASACGPGLGRSREARALFERCLALPVPVLFDADALNLAQGRPEEFSSRTAPTVLTPHPGEAARLLGIPTAGVAADRAGAALELARRSRAVVVLKGFRSLVASPDGRLAIVLAGNPGMATGGAGDVLSGIGGALLSRGLSAWDAARAAAFLHGLAGDLALELRGGEGLVAGDLVDFLPEAFERVRRAPLPR